MRKNAAHSADLLVRQQYLFLELDHVDAWQERSHVHRGGRLHIRVTEREHQFGPGFGQASVVERASPQDEAVVEEPKLRRIEEDHLAQMRLQRLAALANCDSERFR